MVVGPGQVLMFLSLCWFWIPLQEWHSQAHLDKQDFNFFFFSPAYAWKSFSVWWRLLKTNPCISKEGSPRHGRARAAVVTGTGAGLLLCPAAGLAATPLVWAQATLWGHTESCSLFSACLRERWCSKDGRSRNEQLRVSLAPLVYSVPEKASLMPGFWRQCFIACVYLSISLFSRLPHDTIMSFEKKKKATKPTTIKQKDLNSHTSEASGGLSVYILKLWITVVLCARSGDELGNSRLLALPWGEIWCVLRVYLKKKNFFFVKLLNLAGIASKMRRLNAKVTK